MPSLTTLIRNGDLEGIDRALTLDPELAEGHTEQGFSYLMFAAYFRNQAVMERIGRDKSNWTLYDAIAVGDLDRVSNMVDAAPDVLETKAADGFTPLTMAVYFEHIALAQYFLEKGADPSEPAQNGPGITPLHAACTRGNKALALLLLEHGADPLATANDGRTARDFAQAGDHNELIVLLEIAITEKE